MKKINSYNSTPEIARSTDKQKEKDRIDGLMYNLNGVIISESHIVYYGGNWIPVNKHPDAIKIDNYKKK